jgi:hypothetical protein
MAEKLGREEEFLRNVQVVADKLAEQASTLGKIQDDTMRGGVLRSRPLTSPAAAIAMEGIEVDPRNSSPIVRVGEIAARLGNTLGAVYVDVPYEDKDGAKHQDTFRVWTSGDGGTPQITASLDVVDSKTQYTFPTEEEARAAEATGSRLMRDSTGIIVREGDPSYDRLVDGFNSGLTQS